MYSKSFVWSMINSKFNLVSLSFSINLKWEDKRYIGDHPAGNMNNGRQTRCPSNHVAYEDSQSLWKPNLQVLNVLEGVIFASVILISQQFTTAKWYFILAWVLDRRSIEQELCSEV